MLLLASLWPQAGFADATISQRAWLEDATTQLTFLQAKTKKFEAYDGVLSKGYTDSVFWIRLRIEPTTEKTLVLRIRPSFIDSIELYDPVVSANEELKPRFGGDHYFSSKSDYQSLNHGFVIPGSDETRDVYLRIKNSRTMLVYVEAVSPEQANSLDRRQEVFDGIYIAVLAVFLLWALMQWLISREMLIGLFLIKQIVVLAHAIAILGYLHLMITDSMTGISVESITTALVLAYVFTAIGFVLILLREFKPVPWLWWMHMSLLALYLPLAVLLTLGQVRLALQINMTIGLVETLGLMPLTFSTRIWKDSQTGGNKPLLPRWVLFSFMTAQFLVSMVASLSSLGGLQGAEWTLNSPIFAGFVNGLLMTVLLIWRAINFEKTRQRSLLDLEMAQSRADIEQQRREEQERFLTMLTHELKTPIGVARMSLGAIKVQGPQRDRIERALSNINAIVDRCRIADRLEHRQLIPHSETCDLMALICESIASCTEPDRVKVLESNPMLIRSDSQLITICLANLIDNALKYSPPFSEIFIRVQPQAAATELRPGGICVRVSNQAGTAGRPDTTQVFSKYYRSQGARSKSGSGLGLYLTHGIACLLGAELSFQSNDELIEFSLWVPV